jgi:hypothetical protein
MRSGAILCSILLFACGGGDSVAPARVEAEGPLCLGWRNVSNP